MSIDMVAHTIQYILAPVVMISACAILENGLLAHYADINARLRLLSHERFGLVMGRESIAVQPAVEPSYETERLREIDHQIPDLLHRHMLVRDSTLTIYLAVFFFVVDMGVIGVSVMVNSNFVASLALIIFLTGLLALLWGVFLIAIEILNSHRAIHYEVEQALSMSGAHPEKVARK